MSSYSISSSRAPTLTWALLLSSIAAVASAQEVSVLPDSVVRGNLLYKARAELSWSGRGKLGSPMVMGDVDANVTVKNIGPSTAQTAVKGCQVRLRAYLSPSRSGVADFVQFGERYSCDARVTNFSSIPASLMSPIPSAPSLKASLLNHS